MPRAQTVGKPLKELPAWGEKPKRVAKPDTRRAKVDVRARVQPNYTKVKAGVLEAVANLPANKKNLVPMSGTLPEIMVGLALVWLDWHFDWQSSELGGRLYLGGGVIDFKVFLGTGFVVVRVQGSYWHALPERVYKDAVQFTRLHALGYKIADIWEQDLYQAWVENRLKELVRDAVLNAA